MSRLVAGVLFLTAVWLVWSGAGRKMRLAGADPINVQRSASSGVSSNPLRGEDLPYPAKKQTERALDGPPHAAQIVNLTDKEKEVISRALGLAERIDRMEERLLQSRPELLAICRVGANGGVADSSEWPEKERAAEVIDAVLSRSPESQPLMQEFAEVGSHGWLAEELSTPLFGPVIADLLNETNFASEFFVANSQRHPFSLAGNDAHDLEAFRMQLQASSDALSPRSSELAAKLKSLGPDVINAIRTAEMFRLRTFIARYYRESFVSPELQAATRELAGVHRQLESMLEIRNDVRISDAISATTSFRIVQVP